MFTQLFMNDQVINFPVSKDPNTDYVLSSYQREILKVKEYYKNSNFTINSKNVLTRILYHYFIPIEYENETYLRVAYERANQLARAFRFLNPLSFAHFYRGNFYNETNKELFCYTEEYINLTEIVDTSSVNAINVLLHNESGISLELPMGGDRSFDLGSVSIVNINLPLIAYYFKYQRMKELSNTEVTSGIDKFITKMMLPGILESHFDITVFNRVYSLFYSIPFTYTKAELPFQVIDYSYKLDKILLYAIERCRNKKMKYTAMLEHFPSIYKKDLLESLRLPNYVPNRQAHWGYFFSRIKVMEFLIDLGGENGIISNREEINDLKREVRFFLSDNVFLKVFTKESIEYKGIESFFDKVAKL